MIFGVLNPGKIWHQQPLHLPTSPQRWFLVPICRGDGIPQISDMHFQIALTSEHVADFGWVPFSELGD